MNTDTTRTILYQWDIRKGKDKTSLLAILLGSLLMLSLPTLLSPQLTPIVLHIGLIGYSLTWLGLLLGIVIIHEGLHGLFFWTYSRRVKFGVKWKTKYGPTPYATSPNSVFTRPQYQIIALAPQILTAVLFVLSSFLDSSSSAILIIVAIMNLGAGCIDIWSALKVQSFPKKALIEDTQDGFTVWSNV